jgi:hypothetical protein
MNTSTQPPEGAGGSRSKAAGELTLGLLSGGGLLLEFSLIFQVAEFLLNTSVSPLYPLGRGLG